MWLFHFLGFFPDATPALPPPFPVFSFFLRPGVVNPAPGLALLVWKTTLPGDFFCPFFSHCRGAVFNHMATSFGDAGETGHPRPRSFYRSFLEGFRPGRAWRLFPLPHQVNPPEPTRTNVRFSPATPRFSFCSFTPSQFLSS